MTEPTYFTSPMPPPDVVRAHHDAIRLVAQGRVSEAAERIGEIVQGHPDYAPAQHDLGALLWKMGSPEAALEHLGRAHLLEPRNLDTMRNLARLCLDLGLPQDALDVCLRMLEIDPDQPEALLMKGFLLADHGQDAEAEKVLRLAAGKDLTRKAATDKLNQLAAKLTARTESAVTEDGIALERGPIATFIRGTFAGTASSEYLDVHADRIEETLMRMTPFLRASSRVIDVGSYTGELPLVLWKFLGIRDTRCCTLDLMPLQGGDGLLRVPGVDHAVPVARCDIERERWPYENESADLVVCLETLEHLTDHPLFMMAQANRVLPPGGRMVMTTPNAHSFYAITRILDRESPNLLPQYWPGRPGYGHIKEYTAKEMTLLFEAAGFEVESQCTFSPYAWALDPTLPGLKAPLREYGLLDSMSGMLHFVVGKKTGAPKYERIQPIYAETKEWEPTPPA